MGSLHKLVSFVAILCFLCCCFIFGRVDLSLYPLPIYAFLAAQLLPRYIAREFYPPSPFLMYIIIKDLCSHVSCVNCPARLITLRATHSA